MAADGRKKANNRRSDGTFEKGHSIRPAQEKLKGPKRIFMTAEVKRQLADPEKLAEFVASIIDSAKAGNAQAQKMIWDRLEGPVANIHEIGGIDGGPISFSELTFNEIRELLKEADGE
jgi:hypothetical protein